MKRALLPLFAFLALTGCQSDRAGAPATDAVTSWTLEAQGLKVQPITLTIRSDSSFELARVIRYEASPGDSRLTPVYEWNQHGKWVKSQDDSYRFSLEDGRYFICVTGKNPISWMQISELKVTQTDFEALAGMTFYPRHNLPE